MPVDSTIPAHSVPPEPWRSFLQDFDTRLKGAVDSVALVASWSPNNMVSGAAHRISTSYPDEADFSLKQTLSAFAHDALAALAAFWGLGGLWP